MGFFDRAKQLLGLGGAGAEDDEDSDLKDAPKRPAKAAPRGRERPARDRADRPPLNDVPPVQSQSVEDALRAREAGDKAEARRILIEIDRGQGLRTVLRAAA